MGTVRTSGPILIGAVALGALLAGCGSAAPAAGGGAVLLARRSNAIGRVLTTAQGRTVYELAGNTAAHPRCTGSCTSVWPPVTQHGRQVVVAGHPAFTFSGDSAAGQTRGEGVTDSWGHWLALGPGGQPVTAASPAPTAKAASPAGGYGY